MIPRQYIVCTALAAAVLAVASWVQLPTNQAYRPQVPIARPVSLEMASYEAEAPQDIAAIPVTITVDAANTTGALKPIWRWCGYDEPNYTYAANGKKLVGQLTGSKEEIAILGPAYFRAHSLLVTGDGTPHLKWGSTNAYTEDAAGKPVYDWKIVDKIFDTYIEAGAKPYAQVSFMPKALSLRPEPYEHHWKPGDPYGNIYTGWTTPPNDYDKWRELNYQWAKHCVEKYGMKEVESWYWEVWNEPNIDYLSAAVRGGNKQIDYQKIWDYAADGIRKAIPKAIIGGAETAGDGAAFQREFIEHCINGTNHATGQKGSPLGLISFHAKGAPEFVDMAGAPVRGRNNVAQGHVRMGVRNQLVTVRAGFNIVASRPETKGLPVVIGESDPDGCAGCQSANGLYPEYGYRNTTLFASYTIEQLVRTMDLADIAGVNLLGSVTWAFEFEDQPIFGGFRALATDGIALPVANTFRMLNKMGAKRLAVKSSGDLGLEGILGMNPAGRRGGAPAGGAGGGGAGGAPAGGGGAAAAGGAERPDLAAVSGLAGAPQPAAPAGGGAAGGRGTTPPPARAPARGGVRGDRPDIHAIAARDDRRITIISWNYYDDDVAGPAGDISLSVSGLPADLTKVKMTEWRIDKTHSNAHTAWLEMGSPAKPTPEQHAALDKASDLAIFKPAGDLNVADGKADVKLNLPRQAVSLIELSW